MLENAVSISVCTGGITGDQALTRGSDDARSTELLAEIGQIWASYRQHGLEARFSTGVLLNKHIGSPSMRLPYGATVIERVAELLDVDKSEVNRMRRFADMFTSINAFRELHPKAATWTAVRQILTRKGSNVRSEAVHAPSQEAARPTGEAQESAVSSASPLVQEAADASRAEQTEAGGDLRLQKVIASIEAAAAALDHLVVGDRSDLGAELRKALRRLNKAGRIALGSKAHGGTPRQSRKACHLRVVDVMRIRGGDRAIDDELLALR
jgi:hypothetical protein